jgi:hypothetical protein
MGYAEFVVDLAFEKAGQAIVIVSHVSERGDMG